MAEIASGALGAGAAITAAKIAHSLSFSARHDQTHRAEIIEADRITNAFERSHIQGDISEDDRVRFLEQRAASHMANAEYYDSIKEYKETSSFNVVKKVGKRRDVRKKKRAASESVQNLRQIYYSSCSDCSDASSITAQSGSPPGSGLENDSITSWRDRVATSNLALSASESSSSSSRSSSPASSLERQREVKKRRYAIHRRHMLLVYAKRDIRRIENAFGSLGPPSFPLKNGQACTVCRLNGVKCDTVKPICGSCTRNAKDESCENLTTPRQPQMEALNATFARLQRHIREIEFLSESKPSRIHRASELWATMMVDAEGSSGPSSADAAQDVNDTLSLFSFFSKFRSAEQRGSKLFLRLGPCNFCRLYNAVGSFFQALGVPARRLT
ncbi:hypothetical protein HGRIS_011871 [Hohenbuehelia grisea]|uniref:Zn(2)-C6 fungal-type domain-containing protein n=1 Tax=Hohenbuehelia grisea TaxID=104357 RepID=A0ABR3JWK7_9AGAR